MFAHGQQNEYLDNPNCIGLVRRAWPQTSGSIPLEGLTADVTVVRDARGIPQIYADDAVDLFRAQGFVAAQDRFFQMDLENFEQVDWTAFLNQWLSEVGGRRNWF